VILDLFFAIVLGLVELIVGLITSLVPGVPGWLTSALSSLGSVLSYVWQFDAWLPVGLLLTIAAAVFAAWSASVVIGAVRWIVSYFLGGGGTT
jgi:hypothetical protein